jgi:acyl phosphate:glycerol-3-phosphate acyltransferase
MTPAETYLRSLIPIAYLLGSIPFGLIVGLAKGVDPRKAGSGNIGATNVGRLLGARFFLYVFLLDLLKALIPTAVGSWVVARYGHDSARPTVQVILHLLVGFSAIFGHMFSIFIGFKGGKGVACGAGVALGFYPFFTIPGLAALLLWGILFAITRYVSLASIVAAIFFPLAYLALALTCRWRPFTTQLPLLLFATLVGAMVVYRHRSNIARLRAGTESRFVKKPRV